MPKKISIIKPDDWHLHLREGDILKKVLKYSAKNFSRALIMPNLKKPILTYVQAEKYKREILKYLSKGSKFNPLMTLYLTEKTNPKDIKNIKIDKNVKMRNVKLSAAFHGSLTLNQQKKISKI